jgi:hypothetical protein
VRTLILAGFLSSTVVIPSEEEHAAYTSFNIKMEDNKQQWSWTMAVALYGVSSLYNWVVNVISNFRFQPQQTPPAVPAVPPHPSKLNLPVFWIYEPAAWFVFAEAKFRTNHITSQRVMFNLLVAALPEMTLAQVMDIINNILAVNPFEVLKLRLLEAQVLSDQEKMNTLFQLGLLGDRKPSQLLRWYAQSESIIIKTHSKTVVLQDYRFYLLVFFLSLLLFTVPR